jgi:hypothetical protein
MNNNKNLVSNTDTPTPEQIANKTKTQYSEMRQTALYALGKLIEKHLEHVTSLDYECSRSTAADEVSEIYLYLYDIVKIMLTDTFWLDDASENPDTNPKVRKFTKDSFKDNLIGILCQSEGVTKLIKEALA